MSDLHDAEYGVYFKVSSRKTQLSLLTVLFLVVNFLTACSAEKNIPRGTAQGLYDSAFGSASAAGAEARRRADASLRRGPFSSEIGLVGEFGAAGSGSNHADALRVLFGLAQESYNRINKQEEIRRVERNTWRDVIFPGQSDRSERAFRAARIALAASLYTTNPGEAGVALGLIDRAIREDRHLQSVMKEAVIAGSEAHQSSAAENGEVVGVDALCKSTDRDSRRDALFAELSPRTLAAFALSHREFTSQQRFIPLLRGLYRAEDDPAQPFSVSDNSLETPAEFCSAVSNFAAVLGGGVIARERERDRSGGEIATWRQWTNDNAENCPRLDVIQLPAWDESDPSGSEEERFWYQENRHGCLQNYSRVGLTEDGPVKQPPKCFPIGRVNRDHPSLSGSPIDANKPIYLALHDARKLFEALDYFVARYNFYDAWVKKFASGKVEEASAESLHRLEIVLASEEDPTLGRSGAGQGQLLYDSRDEFVLTYLEKGSVEFSELNEVANQRSKFSEILLKKFITRDDVRNLVSHWQTEYKKKVKVSDHSIFRDVGNFRVKTQEVIIALRLLYADLLLNQEDGLFPTFNKMIGTGFENQIWLPEFGLDDLTAHRVLELEKGWSRRSLLAKDCAAEALEVAAVKLERRLRKANKCPDGDCSASDPGDPDSRTLSRVGRDKFCRDHLTQMKGNLITSLDRDVSLYCAIRPEREGPFANFVDFVMREEDWSSNQPWREVGDIELILKQPHLLLARSDENLFDQVQKHINQQIRDVERLVPEIFEEFRSEYDVKSRDNITLLQEVIEKGKNDSCVLPEKFSSDLGPKELRVLQGIAGGVANKLRQRSFTIPAIRSFRTMAATYKELIQRADGCEQELMRLRRGPRPEMCSSSCTTVGDVDSVEKIAIVISISNYGPNGERAIEAEREQFKGISKLIAPMLEAADLCRELRFKYGYKVFVAGDILQAADGGEPCYQEISRSAVNDKHALKAFIEDKLYRDDHRSTSFRDQRRQKILVVFSGHGDIPTQDSLGDRYKELTAQEDKSKDVGQAVLLLRHAPTTPSAGERTAVYRELKEKTELQFQELKDWLVTLNPTEQSGLMNAGLEETSRAIIDRESLVLLASCSSGAISPTGTNRSSSLDGVTEAKAVNAQGYVAALAEGGDFFTNIQAVYPHTDAGFRSKFIDGAIQYFSQTAQEQLEGDHSDMKDFINQHILQFAGADRPTLAVSSDVHLERRISVRPTGSSCQCFAGENSR